MDRFRIYLVMSKKSGLAYIGKGPDGRIEGGHNKQFHRLMKQSDMVQWESQPFSSERDAFIAEAAAIGIAKCIGKSSKLVNIQRSYHGRFSPRYPIRYVAGRISKSELRRAIIVTLSPDTLLDDNRVAPNSRWAAARLAERARKFWHFRQSRVEAWSRGVGSPDVLVAVAKRSAIILAVFKIDNRAWFKDRENKEGLVAVPLKNKNAANANGMQGKIYAGNRQGGAVTYGADVA